MRNSWNKLITLGLMLSAAVSLKAQKMAVNTISDDGRYLLTSDKGVGSDMDVALGAHILKKDTILGMLITCDKPTDHGIFSKSDKVLIRLSDERVITLENIYDREFESKDRTSTFQSMETEHRLAYAYDPIYDEVYVAPYTVTRMVPHAYTSVESKSYGLYLISRKDVMDIIEKGVIKCRIETEDGYEELKKPEKVTKAFQKLYPCLQTGFLDAPRRATEDF